MSIKTEVSAILAANIQHATNESAFYAGIGEYGMSDKIDRIVEGLQVARQAYLATFDQLPAVGPISTLDEELDAIFSFEPLAQWEFDLLYDTLTQKMVAAPVGTKLVPKGGAGVSPYEKVGENSWRRQLADGTFSEWPYAVENFDDEEEPHFEVVIP